METPPLPGCGSFEVKVKPMLIKASPMVVWDVILDFNSYAQWNPFHRNVRSSLRPGDPYDMWIDWSLQLESKWPSCEKVREVVESKDDDHHTLVYGIRPSFQYLYTVRSKRVQTLEAVQGPNGEAYCIYHSIERIGGLASWAIKCLYGKAMERAFHAQALALKNYVETHWANS